MIEILREGNSNVTMQSINLFPQIKYIYRNIITPVKVSRIHCWGGINVNKISFSSSQDLMRHFRLDRHQVADQPTHPSSHSTCMTEKKKTLAKYMFNCFIECQFLRLSPTTGKIIYCCLPSYSSLVRLLITPLTHRVDQSKHPPSSLLLCLI